MVHRRIALGWLVSPVASTPVLAAVAKRRRIGVLEVSEWQSGDGTRTALLDELRRRGYEEGRNLAIISRQSGEDLSQFDRLADELVALKVDLILTTASRGVLAARRATKTIPIVMFAISEAVSSGLVASLSHPGGNVTGNAYFSSELVLKQLELLIETLGKPVSIAYVNHETVRHSPRVSREVASLKAAASAFGLALREAYVSSSEELERVFQSLAKERVQGVVLEGHATLGTEDDALRALILKTKLPTVMTHRQSAANGVPLTYGIDLIDMARKTGAYIGKILDGANPADLPVELPTKFELVINMRTATAIGMAIPPSVLLRATEVIR